ncbi:MAG: glycosyltransferase family 4 protein [Phycisphaerae bacterium]
MNILLLSRYGRLGPSSRVRSYQYLPYLANQGINVTVAPLLENDYVQNLYTGKRKSPFTVIKSYFRRLNRLLHVREYDLIWVEYEIFPLLPAWAESLLVHQGVPYVVDYDDAVFHRYEFHPNPLIRFLLHKKIDQVMKHASTVIAGNEYLVQRASQAGAKHVEYLPSVIDLDQYKMAERSDNPIFTIGWIGSPVTSKYLNLIAPALAQVAETGPIRVVLIGSGPVKLEGVPVEVQPWSEETQVDQMRTFDVGIMPLEDKPFERGKCGYKLIQYMACGLPVVASPVGVNTHIVEDGINGFLAQNPSDWIRALMVLKNDAALRKRMGQAGRLKVEKEYCLQVTAPKLVSILKRILQ